MKFLLELSDEILPFNSGVATIGILLENTNLKKMLNAKKLKKVLDPGISNADIIYAYVGLLCHGKSGFDKIELFRDEPFYKEALMLDTRMPGSSTLSQRLRLGGLEGWDTIITDAAIEFLINSDATISPISVGKKDAAEGKDFDKSLKDYVCLDIMDIDVSSSDISNTSQEGEGSTSQPLDGLSAIFAYLGQDGYIVNVGLRYGKDHSQKNTHSFISASIDNSRQVTDSKVLVRMDPGFDSLDNITVCQDKGVDFIIKRNLREESKEYWLKTAKDLGTCQERRPGDKVYTGHTYIDCGLEEPLRAVFHVTERTILANGQHLIVPELEVCTFWTSLDVEPENIFMAHRSFETKGQFQSEIKSELDLERLPADEFKTNNLVLHLGMLSYNLLRYKGEKIILFSNPSLRKKLQKKRIRTVIQEIINLY